MKINDVRNHFIHRRGIERFKRGPEAKAEYMPLVNEAVKILREKLDVVQMRISR